MQHALVMFFACFNEFCSNISIKDRVVGEVTPLQYESYLAVVACF